MELAGILILVFASMTLLVHSFERMIRAGRRSYEERALNQAGGRTFKYEALVSREKLLVFRALAGLLAGSAGFVAAANLPPPMPFVLMGVSGVLATVVPGVLCAFLLKKRKKLFNDQLVDAMNTIANGLKSGFSFQQSIELASRQLPDPIGQEFRLTVRQAGLGLRLDEALQNMVVRVRDNDLELMSTAVKLTSEIGGDLADVLRQLSMTIQERRRIDGKIDALTSQGKMQAVVVALVPIGLGIVVHFVNPGLMRPMYTTPLGWMLIAGCLLLDFMGFMMIRRIVTIKD